MDPYLHHLVQVSATNAVVVTQDIIDRQGRLLLPKATLLNEISARHLVDSLNLPSQSLASYVALQSQLDAETLLQDLLGVIRATEFFHSLAERKHPLSSLEPICMQLQQMPLLQQSLMVLKMQMAELYERTLCVSLWALYIAQEMRLAVADWSDIFWAAMVHDVGMLYLEPEVLNREEQFSAEDWSYVQRHVQCACDLVRLIPQFSAIVEVAVSEHHERCDGTGYPLAKVESELSLAGQVLAVADAIVGIYFNRFRAHGKRWREVIPVLEMNRAAYLHRSCEIVAAMILRSELPLPNVVHGSGVPEFAERMLQHNLHLQHWFTQLRDCLTSVGYTHGDRQLHALQNVIFHIATTFKGSMLFKDDLRESLSSMAQDDAINMTKVVADAAVMQQEMAFHLQRLTRMLQMYIANGNPKDPNILQQLREKFSSISGYLTQPSPPPE